MSRRRKRRGGLSGLFIFLIIIILLVLAVGVFFRIRDVRIATTGSQPSRHSSAQIEADLMYDILTRNTLYFAWKYKTPVEEPRTPYLDSVQAKIVSPYAVQLIIRENVVIGAVSDQGMYYLFDKNGLILEENTAPESGIPVITVVTLTEPAVYSRISVESAALRSTMLSIAQLMKESELTADEISFDANRNITMKMGNVTIELGQDEYLEEKVSNLERIYPEIENRTGVLNMIAFSGKNERIEFTPGDRNHIAQTLDEAMRQSGGQGITDLPGTAGTDETETEEPETEKTGPTSYELFMAFDAYGVYHTDCHVENGEVVDSMGNLIEGCTLTPEGNVLDAYWNIIYLNLDMSGYGGTQETDASSGYDPYGTGSAYGTDPYGTGYAYGTDPYGTGYGYGTDPYGTGYGYGTDSYGTGYGYGTDPYGTGYGYGTDPYGTGYGYGTDIYGNTYGYGTDAYGNTYGYGTDLYGNTYGYGTSGSYGTYGY